MAISVVTIPDNGPIATRARNNPLYDRTWAGNARRDGVLRFFFHPIGALDGDSDHVKTCADTNMVMMPNGQWTCLPKGWAMHAYGLYACPCLRDVPEDRHEDVRRAVSAIRWSAACELRFGDMIHTEIPAACVLANVVGREPEAEYAPITSNKRVIDVSVRGKKRRAEWDLEARTAYDPAELVEERNQFRITLGFPCGTDDTPAMSPQYPIEISAMEDWHVRLINVALRYGFIPHLRAFVNGVLLKGIQG